MEHMKTPVPSTSLYMLLQQPNQTSTTSTPIPNNLDDFPDFRMRIYRASTNGRPNPQNSNQLRSPQVIFHPARNSTGGIKNLTPGKSLTRHHSDNFSSTMPRTPTRSLYSYESSTLRPNIRKSGSIGRSTSFKLQPSAQMRAMAELDDASEKSVKEYASSTGIECNKFSINSLPSRVAQLASIFEPTSPTKEKTRHDQLTRAATQFSLRPSVLKLDSLQHQRANLQQEKTPPKIDKKPTLFGVAHMPYTPFHEVTRPTDPNVTLFSNAETTFLDSFTSINSFPKAPNLDSDTTSSEEYISGSKNSTLSKRDTLVPHNVTQQTLEDMHNSLCNNKLVTCRESSRAETAKPLEVRAKSTQPPTAKRSQIYTGLKNLLIRNDVVSITLKLVSAILLGPWLLILVTIQKKMQWKAYFVGVDQQCIRFVKSGTKKLHAFEQALPPDSGVGVVKKGNKSKGSKNGCQQTCSLSCIVMPLQGLMWRVEQFPASLLLENERCINQQKSTTDLTLEATARDPMDPLNLASTLSTCYFPHAIHQQSVQTQTTDKCSRQCFRFGHLKAGVELLVAFPVVDAAVISLVLSK
ncbi:hypothetical protein Ciccas_008198, partial [Cichlidogyrus casuarinus]